MNALPLVPEYLHKQPVIHDSMIKTNSIMMDTSHTGIFMFMQGFQNWQACITPKCISLTADCLQSLLLCKNMVLGDVWQDRYDCSSRSSHSLRHKRRNTLQYLLDEKHNLKIINNEWLVFVPTGSDQCVYEFTALKYSPNPYSVCVCVWLIAG